jgi:predicted RNA-binding protein associated with RNAse of E/G family
VTRQTSATIIERKTRLDGSTEDFVCEVLALEPERHAVLRYVLTREWTIAGGILHVPKGAWTVSHYWTDRPYNVYHWLVDGRTLAYYCNIVAKTVITRERVEYEDLVVDVLLNTSGKADILDEDELPDDLPSAHRIAIAKALEVIIANPRFLMREIERDTAEALRGA